MEEPWEVETEMLLFYQRLPKLPRSEERLREVSASQKLTVQIFCGFDTLFLSDPINCLCINDEPCSGASHFSGFAFPVICHHERCCGETKRTSVP